MNGSWIYKPIVFFGKRIYILFAAIMSIPVWLACHTYMNGLHAHYDEASATGVTMCFIAGIFTGRYIEETWKFHTRYKHRKLVVCLVIFIGICICWLFIHADFPVDDLAAINMLLYWLPFMTMSLTIGILIKAVRDAAKRELNEAQRSAAQRESELKLLQSQLSPHFLFNTLNNMYGLSLKQHEKIPALLLKLSDLLRYSVYGTNETLVLLKNEVDYINNYIEFEKIRLGDRLMLKTAIGISLSDDIKIAPMLLIVFVENAFKHSKNTEDEKIFIEMSLKTWNNQVLFSIGNSHNRKEKKFDANGGFGLDNVRKRLELLYPEAYELDIQEDDNRYTVMLQLKTKTQ